MTRTLKSGIRVPAAATFKRYGITEGQWLGMLAEQGGVCPICQRVPPSGKMAVDHQHVRGWKRMTPGDRAKYVRGIVCVWCNRWMLHYSMTPAKAERVAAYLNAYEQRRGSWVNSSSEL